MNISGFCQRKGFTYGGLADLIGVKTGTIADYARNKTYPSYSVCCKLISVGMRLDELFSTEVFESVKENHSKDFKKDSAELSTQDCVRIVQAGVSALGSAYLGQAPS